MLDTIVEDFRTAADSAQPALLAIARGTFGVLAIIEIALSGLFWTLRAEGPYKILTGLVVKLGWLAFAFGLNRRRSTSGSRPVINGFLAAGQSGLARHVQPPAKCWAWASRSRCRWWGAMFEDLTLLDINGPTLTNIVLVALAALVMEVLFAVIAGMVVLVLVESFLVLACGSLVLGFAAFRGTASLADRFVAYVFAVGIKLFVLFLLVSVGMDVATAWLPIIESNPGDVAPMLAGPGRRDHVRAARDRAVPSKAALVPHARLPAGLRKSALGCLDRLAQHSTRRHQGRHGPPTVDAVDRESPPGRWSRRRAPRLLRRG